MSRRSTGFPGGGHGKITRRVPGAPTQPIPSPRSPNVRLPHEPDRPGRDQFDAAESAVLGAPAPRSRPVTELLPMRELGPCIICGVTGYSLSMGGPGICPRCDCGHYDADALAMNNAKLSAELAALRAAPASPEGWVMVPREPTEEMNEAAKPFRKGVGETAERVYRAMIAAAPGVVGGDNSSVAGLPSSQEGSDHQGLTLLEGELLAALKAYASFGCPACNGDCSAANPPVYSCPTQAALAVIAKTEAQACCTFPCPVCGGRDDADQLACEACGGVGLLGDAP